ncbi:soluble NSF attachment protein receptor [Tribonema minus]|uniref:Soluble NSF attachment protein receptor n=1 Tax=Tribonema minus TaxID=303371 RepID=A0A836CD59_9STRA|nr:soluble NSF attachment protein receptor [Tribonema minus]
MNDRLGDLRRGSNADGEVELSSVAIDVEEEAGGKDDMKKFFESIESIKADINAVKAACKQLDSLTEAAIFAPMDKGGETAKDKITEVLAKTNKHVSHAKTLLHDLRTETAALKRDPKRSTNANIRVRANLETTFTRKFVDVAKEYQNKQNRYKSQVKGKAERAVKAVKPTVTEDEMAAVFQQDDGVKRVLEAAVMQQSGDPVEVANVLAEVQDQYEDVRRLEASILELHRMFMDLALLVEQQGETLDVIEFQVKQAGDYVRQGNVSLEDAIAKAKQVRKRQCCMIGIIMAVIAVIIIIIIVFKAGK